MQSGLRSSKTDLRSGDSEVLSLNMDVRDLQSVLAVAEELHFGRAARRLHVSQPALSKRIGELEHELCVQLFARSNKSVELTSHGKKLLPLAVDALRAFDAIDEAMKLPAETDRALRVAFPGTTSVDIPKALQNRCAAWNVGLDWTEVPTADQHAALLADRLDLGVLRLPIGTTGLWVSAPLRRSVGVLTSPEHALAGDEPVSLSALTGRTLLMFPRSRAPGLHDHMVSACLANGFRPRAIKHGMWLSYPGLLAQSELPSGAVMLTPRISPGRVGNFVWRAIKDDPLMWETAVCCRLGNEKDHLVQAAAQTILQALQEHDDWRSTD